MAATERWPLERVLACAALVIGAFGCAPVGPTSGGVVIADAGAFGDGGLETTIDKATGEGIGDVPSRATGRSCQQLAAFTSAVTPVFSAHCIACHNGTLLDATQLLDLSTLRDSSVDGQQTACDNTLSTTDASALADSSIFTFPDPDSAVDHDFKFGSAAEFAAYRASVLQWLSQE